MIGEVIRNRGRGFVIPTILTAMAAAIWLATANNDSGSVIRGLTIPILLAVAAAVAARRPFEAIFSDECIEVVRPFRRKIKFADVSALQFLHHSAGTSRRIARPAGIVLYDLQGRCVIPKKLTHPLADVLEFIIERIGFGGSRQVEERLMEYRRTQEALFGADRVYCYVARRDPAPRYGICPLIFGLILIAVASLLPFTGASGEKSASVFVGLMVYGPIGLVAAFAAAARMGGVPNSLRSSSLVISPIGLAMVQGGIVGQLEWRELRGIRRQGVTSTRRNFEMTRRRTGVVLRVEGAEIGIADIYDRPTSNIERLIRLFWQGNAICDACGAALSSATGPGCPMCRTRLTSGRSEMPADRRNSLGNDPGPDSGSVLGASVRREPGA